jgi:hypothetical protein
MNRREFSRTCLASAASLAAGAGVGFAAPDSGAPKVDKLPGADSPAFKLRGVYFHDGFDVEPRRLAPLYWREAEWRRQLTWLSACGVNAIEFATMLEFNRIPSTPLEQNKIADRLKILDLAHRQDVKFGYILSNTVVSTVPPHEEPGNQLADRAQQLCPLQPGNFERTVDLQTWYVDTYKEADFFEEFAADWGACFCGQCGVNQYLRYVEEFAHRIDARNKTAKLYANTWCVSYWGPNPIPLGWRHVFERETEANREVIVAIPRLPANTHLAMPCHNLYRQLVFNSFGGKQTTPEFPTRADLQVVQQAGREVLAWPHFLMDDDVGRAPQWGLVHCEVRYLRAMLAKLRAAGIDQVIGNLYLPNLQLVNAYAFGRLTQNLETEPQAILGDFARLIAQPEDTAALTDVLCWLDNSGYWNHQLPADAREPGFDCTLDKNQALSTLKSIRPRASSDLPLPVSPAQWLEDLVGSVPKMSWAN